MKTSEQEVLLDILENTESLDKIRVELHEPERDVVVIFEDVDDEWFRELKEAQASTEIDPYNGLLTGSIFDNFMERCLLAAKYQGIRRDLLQMASGTYLNDAGVVSLNKDTAKALIEKWGLI